MNADFLDLTGQLNYLIQEHLRLSKENPEFTEPNFFSWLASKATGSFSSLDELITGLRQIEDQLRQEEYTGRSSWQIQSEINLIDEILAVRNDWP